MPQPAHIGDGVYASFDGYHLNLAVNDHRNHVVALEPAVMRQLVAYAASVNSEHGVQHFTWPSVMPKDEMPDREPPTSPVSGT